MAKVMCGGTCGGGGLFSIPDPTFWSSCIPVASISPTLFSRTHLSGTSTLFIASKHKLETTVHHQVLVNVQFHTAIHTELLILRISSFSNVVITNMIILAPHDSPNTDGIDPGMLFSSIFGAVTNKLVLH